MAVRVAASLRLADLMTEGPVPVAELARRSGTDADALGRLLRHLVCKGIFTEPEHGAFAVNEPAALLAASHPSGMRRRLDLDGFGGRMDLAFTGLAYTVRTGEPAWETVFGIPLWRYLAENEEIGESFDAMMASGDDYVADAVRGYDWSSVRHVVDVGGGTGAFLAGVLGTDPGMRGTLVDLPETVDRARRHLADKGLERRCAVVAGSFFDPLPPGGDVYVLRRVVHDWGDEDAVRILRRCAEAATRGRTIGSDGKSGRVLVIETPSGSAGNPATLAEMDLRMLVFCGGRERATDGDDPADPGDYAPIIARAGLDLTGVHRTPLGHVVLDCVPGAGTGS
ncbi:hypothetical protein BAY61_19805 [Prauserella marina]|nr:hypothetical protein BAY61_19805 [Prauserella marina]